MSSYRHWLLVVLLLSLAIFPLAACGGGPAPEGAQPGAAPAKAEYKVGETADVGGILVTVHSAKFESGILTADITVENQLGSEITVSSSTNFLAVDNAGQEGFSVSCLGAGTVGGVLLKGEKLRGLVCWLFSNPQATGFKITYDGKLYGKGKATFVTE
ncbi:MAG: DUF4352 domain-containing protein [Chloroflexi bacterium]|nr:DUF4352 domain-containing protein [Chloroflexota bacterium]